MAATRQAKQSALEVLIKARALLSDERRWTRHVYAVGPGGRRTDHLDPKACAWCAAGAIYKIGGSFNGGGAAVILTEAVCEQWPGESIAGFNDDPDTTHDHLLIMFDRAIEIARAVAV
ncbi:MAG: hypothetical protein POG24_05425 [Acidocella sp.]|nr:hypothetical protein [Acidocella sp.]